MKTILVVTQPFADYARGDHITDPEAVAKALVDHGHHVVKAKHPGEAFYAPAEVEDDDEPETPAPKAKRKPAAEAPAAE